MATQAELKRERELLAGFGLNPVRTWSARCKWYKAYDGSYHGELPSDMYSRLRYMERGLRPELTESDSLHLDVRRKVESMRYGCLLPRDRASMDDFRLASAVNYLVTRSDDYWRGTATDLFYLLKGKTNDIAVDATRLSKRLNNIASHLLNKDVVVEHVRSAKTREIVLRRPSR